MAELVYQPLTQMECIGVLRAVHVTRAAVADGERPYVVPMAFQLAFDGTAPLIYLCLPDHGRKADCLCRCDRICLEFEQPGCAWVDVVLAEGQAVPDAWEKGAGLALHLRAETLSGRRFYLPEDT